MESTYSEKDMDRVFTPLEAVTVMGVCPLAMGVVSRVSRQTSPVQMIVGGLVFVSEPELASTSSDPSGVSESSMMMSRERVSLVPAC